jgi:hypothetical protein
MKDVSPTSRNRRCERGAAVVLLLFAMSAFSVLATAALTTTMREAPSGSVYGILSGVRDGDRTKFVAPLVVPNSWRLEGDKGSYLFELPVLVPEETSQKSGASAAWHTMGDFEVPGMTVCCESTAGVCQRRTRQEGEAAITDWTPSTDDAQWLSFDLGHQSESSGQSDLVTATLLKAARENAAGTPLACQMEFKGAIIAKAYARVAQVHRQEASEVPTDPVEGTLDIVIRK